MLRFGRRTAFALAVLGAFTLAISGLLAGCDSGGSGEESGPNQKPSVTISSPSGGEEFARNDAISFSGSAEDPEDDSLTGDALTWKSSVDGEFGTGQQVTTSSLSSAEHTITLTATDQDGATGKDSISIAVNGPPTASISSPSDETAFDEGNTLTFEGAGTDPVDGELSGDALEWSSDVDGKLGTGESLSVTDLSRGPHTITLKVTDSDGNTVSDSADIVVESPSFEVRLRFLSNFTSSQKTTIRNALSPWTAAITGDLAPRFPSSDAAEKCRLGEKGIDDLALAVRTASLDGAGGTLAQAGPCLVRTDEQGNFTTSSSGIVTIDEADLDDPALEQIVTHEVGHALGIGIGQIEGWGTNVSGLDTPDPFHAGSNTTNAFGQLDDEAYLSEGVPVANRGGRGTRGAHWREVNFETELMTGFINAGTENPLSRVSLAALEDIGYPVDLSAADSYSLPMPQAAIWQDEADATLSHPDSSGANFGQPDGAKIDTTLVAGSNNDQLWSQSPEDEVFSSLVRFKIPSSLPTNVTVEQARIRLTVASRNTETTDHNVGIYPVSESWSEGSVTWDNRPARKDSVEAFDFQSCNRCALDLTNLATNWVSGNTSNHGVALRAPDASSDPTFSVGFFSRHVESPLRRPRVVVEAKISGKAFTTRPGRLSTEKISLGDDIRSGLIFGIGPENRVVKTKRLR